MMQLQAVNPVALLPALAVLTYKHYVLGGERRKLMPLIIHGQLDVFRYM